MHQYHLHFRQLFSANVSHLSLWCTHKYDASRMVVPLFYLCNLEASWEIDYFFSGTPNLIFAQIWQISPTFFLLISFINLFDAHTNLMCRHVGQNNITFWSGYFIHDSDPTLSWNWIRIHQWNFYINNVLIFNKSRIF